MIFNLYIFDRKGTCLYFREWQRQGKPIRTAVDLGEARLMYGLLYSMKKFVDRLSPTKPLVGLRHYTTASYKLHLYETPSGFKFALTTDVNVADATPELKTIYAECFVEKVTKNPLYEVGKPITSPEFATDLENKVRALKYF